MSKPLGPRKMNWGMLEERIRTQLELANSYQTNVHATQNDLARILLEISNIVGEETGRGYAIDEAICDRFPDKGEVDEQHNLIDNEESPDREEFLRLNPDQR